MVGSTGWPYPVCYPHHMREDGKPRVTRHTVSDEMERLATYVGRMERRYECTSAFAEEAVSSGALKETAEISSWLTTYRMLTKLSEVRARGTGAGFHMSATR